MKTKTINEMLCEVENNLELQFQNGRTYEREIIIKLIEGSKYPQNQNDLTIKDWNEEIDFLLEKITKLKETIK